MSTCFRKFTVPLYGAFLDVCVRFPTSVSSSCWTETCPVCCFPSVCAAFSTALHSQCVCCVLPERAEGAQRHTDYSRDSHTLIRYKEGRRTDKNTKKKKNKELNTVCVECRGRAEDGWVALQSELSDVCVLKKRMEEKMCGCRVSGDEGWREWRSAVRECVHRRAEYSL